MQVLVYGKHFRRTLMTWLLVFVMFWLAHPGEAADGAAAQTTAQFAVETTGKYKVAVKSAAKTANTTIIFLWTDRDRLKAVSVLTINKATHRAGIVTIPKFSYCPGYGPRETINDTFQRLGRSGLLARLQKYCGTRFNYRVEVEQQTLEKLSAALGTFSVNGDVLNMAEAFSETCSGQRLDDQDIVRAIARRVCSPESWLKLPKMAWIIAADVKSNLTPGGVWRLLGEFRTTDTARLRKTSLPGREYQEHGVRFREVPRETWQTVFRGLTEI